MGQDKLGRYVILRTLGKGAMGMVYEARDPNLDRRVAIKTIKVEHLSREASAEYEARFRTEARSAARLQHPNIVSVYDSDRHGDVAYLVMEFVSGDDLKKILDSGQTYSLEQTLRVMRDLLSALEYAHRQNIVHRDVKPANMLVEADGRVKLTDFGVARIQDSGEATRTRGSMVGTLKYMAPEQVQGLPVDDRADIFAAGVVLYQLLTGRRPFDGGSDFAVIQQIVGAPPAAPSRINPLLPPAVDAVVGMALAKARNQRYASAQAFMVALQEAVGQVPDPTFLPPKRQRQAGDSADTGSRSQRSHGDGGAGTSPAATDGLSATVIQELELVYWKDVKDSNDASDLHGFLERFPNGIYADLARRRVRRLQDPAAREGTGTAMQTRVVDGSSSYSGFAATQPMNEETVLMDARTGFTPVLAQREGTATEDSAGALAALATAPRLLDAPPGEGYPVGGATSSPAGPSSPTAASSQAAVDAGSEASATAPDRTGKWLAGVIALLLSVALGVWWLEPAPSAVAEPATPNPAVARSADGPSLSAPGGLAAAASAVTGTPLAPVSEPVTALATGNAPAAQAADDGTPARTEVEESRVPATGKPTVRKAPNTGRTAGRLSANDPEKGCEGRILLGFQTCMNAQCDKPEFFPHAICRQRRMAEQARAAQHNSRN